jgi:hypothetical protein
MNQAEKILSEATGIPINHVIGRKDCILYVNAAMEAMEKIADAAYAYGVTVGQSNSVKPGFKLWYEKEVK